VHLPHLRVEVVGVQVAGQRVVSGTAKNVELAAVRQHHVAVATSWCRTCTAQQVLRAHATPPAPPRAPQHPRSVLI
jgi:hypothetical protein